jgi:hypothetical protein
MEIVLATNGLIGSLPPRWGWARPRGLLREVREEELAG